MRAVAPPSDRSVGFVFVAVLAFATAWLAWTGRPGAGFCASTAAVLAAVSIARPALLAPLNRAWMRFGALLHRIVSPIVLGIVFFALVTPYALVMRLAGRDALRLRRDAGARSYWIDRSQEASRPDAMRQQF
jgi:hypothetical protein